MSKTRNPQRRRFLKTLGVGTAAAGTAAAIGHVTLAQAESDKTDKTDRAPETSDLYRETPHIRAFYATLRD